MQLPASLRADIETLLDGAPLAELALHYKALSERYRRQGASGSLQIQNKAEALAYMASRLPATYGAVAQVLSRLQAAWPGFAPRSLLDLGAGPGTATLAALDFWQPETVTLVEPNSFLGYLAGRLLKETAARVEATTLQAYGAGTPADLVLLSYVLNELPPDTLDQVLEKTWARTGQALIIVEPGTPFGYQTVLKARDRLLRLGAFLTAPCPHSLACPLAGSSRWCHFSERIDRSSAHRLIKDRAALGYEDEKFSYVIFTRQQLKWPDARVIGHPHGTKLIELELCLGSGLAATRIFSKRDPAYKSVKKIHWGDGMTGSME